MKDKNINKTESEKNVFSGKIAENKDAVDDADELEEGRRTTSTPDWEQQQFVPIESDDDELPF